jgi:hypothetical protein
MITFISVAVTALTAWALIKIGIGIGESRAAASILEGYGSGLCLPPDAVEWNEVNQYLASPWDRIGWNSRSKSIEEVRNSSLGTELAKIAFSQGSEAQRKWMRRNLGKFASP